MIIALLAAAVVPCGDITVKSTGQIGGIVTGCIGTVGSGPVAIDSAATAISAEVCNPDPNVPITVCASGWPHAPRLILPAPPCGTEAAKDAQACVPWTSPEGKAP